MPKRIFYFVVVLILLLNGEIFAQQDLSLLNGEITPSGVAFQHIKFKPLFQYNKDWRAEPIFWNQRQMRKYFFLNYPYLLNVNPLQPSYYKDQLGFFCKKELQLQKLTTVPFRFRLGSLAYTDYLEGKPNSFFSR